MKKFFVVIMGVTCGLILSLAILGAGIYWWIEVRIPEPPELTVEVDGFPDTRTRKDGKEVALIRIVVTNNGNSKLYINDAYLYLTRASDGARANMRYEVDDIVIYPKEKYLEIVETVPVKEGWITLKDSDEFDKEEDYRAYKERWIAQIRDRFAKFNFSFVSDQHNIRLLLDTQEKIAEMENKEESNKD